MLFNTCLAEGKFAQTACIWRDNQQSATAFHELERILTAEQFNIVYKRGCEITVDAFKRNRPDLLVLPYGDQYPVELTETLQGFCKSGGAIMVMGEHTYLQQPVFTTPDGVWKLHSATQKLLTITPDSKWTYSICGPNDAVSQATWNKDTLEIKLILNGFAYAGSSLKALSNPDLVFEFQIRGEKNDEFVSLDLQEADGSRWKRIIPLANEWRTHRVHLAEFVPYYSKSRGKAGDHLNPRNIKNVFIGATAPMMHKGECHIQLRNMSFLQAEIKTATVVGSKRFTQPKLKVANWFGDNYTFEPALITLPEFENDRSSYPLQRGAIQRHSRGVLKGSQIATVVMQNSDDAQQNAAALTETVRALTKSLWVQPPQPVFRVEDGTLLMDVQISISNPSLNTAEPTYILTRNDKTLASGKLKLEPRQNKHTVKTIVPSIPAPHLEREKLELNLQLQTNGAPVFGGTHFFLDAREELRRVCDFMLQQAQAEAKLHGNTFIDNRGMRTLIGGYEIFSEVEYLKMALRWGNRVVDEQREDGGYRMGYGITKHGESCFVADGGEILVGILRLAAYAEGEQRQRFLKSADAYMRYRDEFRVQTGGIGVGWCLHDFGKRPIEPLDKPTRIFAPEKNTYTIGCTLAGAYGHAALRQKPELFKAAQKDADWLMPRVKSLNGASAESFIFAHHFAVSSQRRKLYADFLREKFLAPLLKQNQRAWWLFSGGRCAFNLNGLAYYLHNLEGGAEVQAEIYRALCAMYSPVLPDSIPDMIQRKTMDHDRWIYICYGTLGLVDVIRPMTTLEKWQ